MTSCTYFQAEFRQQKKRPFFILYHNQFLETIEFVRKATKNAVIFQMVEKLTLDCYFLM